MTEQSTHGLDDSIDSGSDPVNDEGDNTHAQDEQRNDHPTGRMSRRKLMLALDSGTLVGGGGVGSVVVGDSGATDAPRVMTDGGRIEGLSPTEGGDNDVEELHLITQLTRANVIQNILGHPCMMPSVSEVDYYNPGKSTGTISNHLEELVKGGIVMRVYLPQGERSRDLPSTFFTLTDEGYDLLDRHDLFLPSLQQIREDHARVEKTEKFKKYERAPRPTVDVEYDHPLQGDGFEIVRPAEGENGCEGYDDAYDDSVDEEEKEKEDPPEPVSQG